MGTERWERLRDHAAARLAERDAALADAAEAWARFVQERGWTPHDMECLWEGLTEEMVRRAARDRGAVIQTLRVEVLTVMAALRVRILGRLTEAGGR